MKTHAAADDPIDAIHTGLREAMRLKKFLMADVAHDLGNPRLNPTHYRTMMLLSHHGPACMNDLCRRIGLEAGSFTTVADRIIGEGLAERTRDEADRRRVLLRLTPGGETAVIRVKKVMHDQLQRKLSVLDDRFVRELAASMDLIRRANDLLQGTEHDS